VLEGFSGFFPRFFFSKVTEGLTTDFTFDGRSPSSTLRARSFSSYPFDDLIWSSPFPCAEFLGRS